MKILHMWTVASALALLPGAIRAQQVERITFQQAIDLALRQNLDVRRAENTIETQRLSVSQAGSSIWPTFGLNASAGNSLGRVFDVNTGTLINKQTQSASSSVSSGIVLFDAGRRNNVASARSSLAATEAELERQRQTAVYTVAQNFVTYVSAQSQLDVQKENLAALRLQEQQIQRFADAGARPISDLFQIQSQVANAQLQVTQAEAAIENGKFALMRTLQLDPAKDYEFVRPDIPETMPTVNYNLDSLVQVAYTRRRDIVSAQNRLAAARSSRRAAATGHIPDVSLSASYQSSGRFGQAAQSSGGPGTFTEQFDQNRGGNIGLGFSIPIFDRGNTRLSTIRAEIDEENAQLQLASTRQAVALDVRQAWYAIRSAQQQLVAAQAGLTAATQALEATQQRYNVGAATLLDVTQARAQRIQALTALTTARFTLVLNQAAMSYFTGELDPKAMTIGR